MVYPEAQPTTHESPVRYVLAAHDEYWLPKEAAAHLGGVHVGILRGTFH